MRIQENKYDFQQTVPNMPICPYVFGSAFALSNSILRTSPWPLSIAQGIDVWPFLAGVSILFLFSYSAAYLFPEAPVHTSKFISYIIKCVSSKYLKQDLIELIRSAASATTRVTSSGRVACYYRNRSQLVTCINKRSGNPEDTYVVDWKCFFFV